MEDKINMINKISIVVLFVFILMGLMACSSQNKIETYKVMISNGIGYTVVDKNVLEVNRGSSASFKIEVEKGYKYFDSNFGKMDNGSLIIDDVKRDINVEIYCRRTFDINTSITNGLISVLPLEGDFYEHSKVEVKVEPLPNYYLDKIIVNETEEDVEIDIDGKARFEITLDQNLEINAICIGDQYNFVFQITGLGSLMIEGNEFKNNENMIINYGTTIKIQMIPEANGKISWVNLDGKLSIPTIDIITIDINDNVLLQIAFSGENDLMVLYDENGGTFTETIIPTSYSFGSHINLDNCYGKLQKEGYILTGLNTKADGSGENYNLGSLYYVKEDTIFYAKWEPVTPIEYLSYSIEGDFIVILGLSQLGINAKPPKIVIPEIISNLPVKKIKKDSFNNLSFLQEVITNKNIEEIESNFLDCYNFSSLVIFENLKSEQLEWSRFPEQLVITINSTLKIVFGNDGAHTAIVDRFLRMTQLAEKKRIIIVSGSSSAHGIDSALIESSFEMEYDIVNLGLLARHGVRAILDIVSKLAREGDIVIVKPEYYMQMFAALNTEYYSNWRHLESNYNNVKYLNIKNNLSLIKQSTRFFNEKRQLIEQNYQQSGDRYSIFNKYGDITKQYDIISSPVGNYQEVSLDYITSEGMAFLNQINNKFLLKQVKFYFSFSPRYFNKDFTDLNLRTHIDLFERKLSLQLDFPVISTIEKNALPREYFFDDMNCHIVKAGTAIHTKQLIDDLKFQLKKEQLE